MRFPIPTLVRTLLAGAALLAAFVVVAPQSRADELDVKIKEMLDFEKAKDDGKCIAKLQELRDSHDPRVLAAIKSITDSKSDKVACAAIKWVAARKDAKFRDWLLKKADDKD